MLLPCFTLPWLALLYPALPLASSVDRSVRGVLGDAWFIRLNMQFQVEYEGRVGVEFESTGNE